MLEGRCRGRRRGVDALTRTLSVSDSQGLLPPLTGSESSEGAGAGLLCIVGTCAWVNAVC